MSSEGIRKIAVITDDGITISQHFGRAPYYMVVTVENGQITDRELREKLAHGQFTHQAHAPQPHGQGHGQDPASHNKHVQMAHTIADCETLICGGMGMGAYNSMRALGIRPIVTSIATIDQAVLAYVKGEIEDETELLH